MIVLDDWQQKVLEHKGNLLLCTGRRVGKTYIMARKAIDRMMQKKTKVLIFSLTEEQSMLILEMAKQYCREAYPKEMKHRNTDTNKKTLTLRNGSIMRCRPAGDTGDSGRGFDADIVIVDEAARMGKFFWIAALPTMLMTAGERWLASTPFGKHGYFWDRFNEAFNLHDPKAEYTVFYETTENVVKTRAITAEWTEERREKILNILENDKKTMSKLEYGQEYLGLFLEDLQQFFPDELIKKCQILKRPDVIDRSKDYFMGQDIARMGEDETTTEIGYFVGETLIHVENLQAKHTYLSETLNSNIDLNRVYDFVKMLIDDEGIGIGVFDMMMDNSELKYKTIGINNSKRIIDKDGKEKGILKTDLYYNLRAMMEKGEIRLLEDASIFQSLKSVQYEYDVDLQGNPRIKLHGNYTHIAEGLIRLAWARKYKHLNFQIYSIKV